MWVKGAKLIDTVPVPAPTPACNSSQPYSLAQMLRDQGRDAAALQNITMQPGEEILVEIGGNDYAGLDLKISRSAEVWDLARDFSLEQNPSGPWAYGTLAIAEGRPAEFVAYDSVHPDFDPDRRGLLGRRQQAWFSKSRAPHLSLMKSRGGSPARREIRFASGPAVYLEALLGGRYVGRYWASDGRINVPYERWAAEAFQIEINQEPVTGDWQWSGASEQPRTERGGRHFVVELANARRPLAVKVHTVLDATPVFTRWLEIQNRDQKPMALTAVWPWTSQLLANAVFWGNPDPPKRFEHAFTLGCFTRSDHCWEGWFNWQPVAAGHTVVGCDKGQCYDDPFFLLRNEGTGQYLVGQLAWSANWRLELDYRTSGVRSLRFRVGPVATDALRVVAPNETVATPAVHLGLVGEDLDGTVQALHEHLRKSVIPTRKANRSFLIQYAVPGDQGYLSETFGNPANYTEQTTLKHVDLAAAIGAELFIMDAGWWENQGDWFPSPTRFPRGLTPIVDYCHRKGLRFGLYGEIEKASPGSKVAGQHPDWIEWHKPYPVLDLARPEVAAYMESALGGMIDQFRLDLFRLDFNTPSATPFEGRSHARDGFAENNFWRYYDSFYQIFDRIHRKYPALVLQQAACGGGRNDLGTAGRFHEQYLTDGLRMPYELQNYCGQTLGLPPEGILIAHGADGGGGVGQAENFATYLRMTYSLSTPWVFFGMVAPSLGELSPARRDAFLRYGRIYREFIRPLWPSCRMYHHAPVNAHGGVESSPWFAVEFAAPDQRRGWATIVRIGHGPSDTYSFRPRGLDVTRRYRVTFDRLGRTITLDGWSLLREGLPIRLEAFMSSELLLFDAEP